LSAKLSSTEALRDLLKRVRQIELRTRKLVNAQAGGAYHSRFKGRGMAFSESRAYVPGDDPRHVDWNTTARTGEVHVKLFVEERELTLLLAVDLSGSMKTGSVARLKRQVATEAAGLLAFSALRNNDKVGLLLFSDRIERLVRPAKGRSHVLRLLRDILSFAPQGRGTDLPAAAQTVSHLSRQRAIVVFVSDLLGITEPTAPGATRAALNPDFERALKVLARRHDLIVLEVADPLERQIPDVGLLALVDPETGAERVIDTSSRRARERYKNAMSAYRANVRAHLTRLGIEHLHLVAGEDPSTALVRFLRRRAASAS
jgi:uncharacterized protein (DUF58 family)